MKRLCCIIIVVAVTFNLAGNLPVSAAKKIDPSKMTIAEYITEHMLNYEKEIELIYYRNKLNDDSSKLWDEIYDAFYNSPELFHFDFLKNGALDLDFDMEYISNELVITSWKLIIKEYSYTESTYKKKKAELDKATKEALQYAANCSTDAEKALAIHDYIALNTEYNDAAADSMDDDLTVFYNKYTSANDAYGVLVDKKAICTGYTAAYMYLLKQLGIDSVYVSSDKMEHAWNYVKVDNKWYHVDVTWDDPSYDGKDLLGGVEHEYFLLSDKEIKKRDHHDWTIVGDYPKATSTKYNNYFWREVDSAIIKLDNYWYWIETDKNSPVFIDNYFDDLYDRLYTEFYDKYEKKYTSGKITYSEYSAAYDDFYDNYSKLFDEGMNVFMDIMRYNITTGKKSSVYSFRSLWRNKSENSYYVSAYSCLALYNGRLYFNTADKIYSVNAKGGDLKTAVKPSNTTGCIFGMKMNGNKLVYTIMKNSTDAGKLYSKSISSAKAKGISLNVKSSSISVGKTKTLKATTDPKKVSDHIYWVSSDPKIATVENGKVTGVKKGKCVITAYTDSGVKAVCNITIK